MLFCQVRSFFALVNAREDGIFGVHPLQYHLHAELPCGVDAFLDNHLHILHRVLAFHVVEELAHAHTASIIVTGVSQVPHKCSATALATRGIALPPRTTAIMAAAAAAAAL